MGAKNSRQIQSGSINQEVSSTALVNQLSSSEEVFPNPQLTAVLETIILNYLNGDINYKTCTPSQLKKFMLFGRNLLTIETPLHAQEAAKQILLGNADRVLELVKQNPQILNFRIQEIPDPRPRLLELEEDKEEKNNEAKNIQDLQPIILRDKTLLQIAGAAGKFNPRQMKQGEKDYGLVERLSVYLSKKEIAKQLSEQFPSGWEEETKQRTEAYFAASTAFGEALINIQLPGGAFFKYKECKQIIKEYRIALANIVNQEVKTGLIFSPEILRNIILYLETNVARLGGWNTNKSNLYAVVGYGSLQFLSLDADIIKTGSYYIVKQDKRPDSSLIFLDGTSFYGQDQSFGLGRNFYIDDFALHAWMMLGDDSQRQLVIVEDFMSNKTSAVQTYSGMGQSIKMRS